MWEKQANSEQNSINDVKNLNNQDYKDQKWYKELSKEQKELIDKKILETSKIKKIIENKKAEISFKWLKSDILTKWLKNSFSWTIDSEDINERKSFEERIDMINRDIYLLSRELYFLNLKLNTEKLDNAFKKSNSLYKENFLKKWETNTDIIWLVENKNLSNITAWEVYYLKQEWYDLSKLFLVWWTEVVNKDWINIWDKFIVNFWWNKSLNRLIWAWDLLPIDKIDKVKINWIEWERRLEPRPGYYSKDGKYLSIFDNYSIEIISKNEYLKEEKSKSLLAFQNRFEEIRKPEVINKFRKQLFNNWDNNSIFLDWFMKSDLKILEWYLSNNISKENLSDLSFDLDNWILLTRTWESLNNIINKFIPNESLWKWYEKYKDIVINISRKYWIKTESLITLINHENPNWDPLLGAPWSSAYWLWQMIDSTWKIYWNWLNRSNPSDQLEATCRYLAKIKERKWCSDEIAMAYYNTWEWIFNVSLQKVREYARLNPAISKKIPDWENINAKTYFKAAIAYYNDKSYDEITDIF